MLHYLLRREVFAVAEYGKGGLGAMLVIGVAAGIEIVLRIRGGVIRPVARFAVDQHHFQRLAATRFTQQCASSPAFAGGSSACDGSAENDRRGVGCCSTLAAAKLMQ